MARVMKIAAPGDHAPAVGFDTPLAMLAECHRRIEDRCATLQRLVPHLAARGSDRPAAEAATAVLRYFDVAAPDHHADEEQDLFPALIESVAGSDALCIRELIDGLRAEHTVFEQQWGALRQVLAMVSDGRPARLDGERVEAFVQAYHRHIVREEDALLPMAARLISDAEMARIGESMQRRRRVPGATSGHG